MAKRKRKRNIYEMNYARLAELLGHPPEELAPDVVHRRTSEGFMDLVLERLSACHETGAPMLSLAHYYEVNGDLCQDPEVVVRIFPPGMEGFEQFAPSTDSQHGRIEAFLFQQAIPPVFHPVYPYPGRVIPRYKRSVNGFLAFWLKNLKAQGFGDNEALARPHPLAI